MSMRKKRRRSNMQRDAERARSTATCGSSRMSYGESIRLQLEYEEEENKEQYAKRGK